MSKKILIVEDDGIVADDLRTILERHGYEITEVVSDGRSAIENCANNTPDLILMDIVLKGDLNGLETAVIIQSAGLQTPIIFLTGFSRSEFTTPKATTSFHYINKPFEEEELVKQIESILQDSKTD